MKKKKAYLTLQNGKMFEGYRFGALGSAMGELVFSTGMVGYMETLTDPANYGQIVAQTFPLIGNYGVIRKDAESDRAWVSAFVVREICEEPSNFRMEGKLSDYLAEEGVIGIYGVDTRELTKILREEGVMNARISDKPLTAEEIAQMASYKIENAVKTVVREELGYFEAENATRTLALWNFGSKNSTIANLNAQGCNVISIPASAKAEEILALGIDGIVVSDGPGDVNEIPEYVEEAKKLLGKKPILGIGLGHHLLAAALGSEIVKQKYGHRGSNQPVKCTKCGKVYISAQNHGYEVVSDTVKNGEISFINVNDGSCEGIEYPAFKALSVQFVPESCGIGHTENPVYDKFFALMKEER